MADGTKDSIPSVLRALWELEKELRDAARNGVIFRREEARSHLQHARHHLDQLLKIVRGSDAPSTEQSSATAETSSTTISNNRL